MKTIFSHASRSTQTGEDKGGQSTVSTSPARRAADSKWLTSSAVYEDSSVGR
ncbi:hypothetical protein [Archangium primigenium]|uniref:hypothetical protein n=1 Tax=[Archangium] primigenium TaxID=2792470 RepID=UPI001EF86831|nr:hypothetical protein [Archangium primigenium]